MRTRQPLSLPALDTQWARQTRQWHVLDPMHRAVNGPFHVIHPGTFARNLRSFKDAITNAGVTGQVFYGKKANKAHSWIPECARHNGGVDVASVPELRDALSHGITGDALMITGAAKNDDLLWLARRHQCLIAIDSLDELRRIAAIEHAPSARILLRVLPPTGPHSRFGFNDDELASALIEADRHNLRVEGFSFHLDGYQVEPRAILAHQLIDRCIDARRSGHPAAWISIGGGFAVNYVDPDDWRRFQSLISANDFHANKTFDKFYPYSQSPTGAAMLTTILRYRGLADRLVQAGISLALEPGRALVDGAGFSVFPILGYKPRTDADHGIVTVNGLSMSVSEQWKGSEFLLDPILVSKHTADKPVVAYIGGSSCMEYDVLTWRKVSLPQPPSYGDYLIYPNTAGYQMDKNESEFHQLPLPPKIAVTVDEPDTATAEPSVRWTFDENAPLTGLSGRPA